MAFSNKRAALAGVVLAALAWACSPTDDGPSGNEKGVRFDTTYYPGGKIELIETRKDSLLDGYMLVWYESGSIKKQGHYKNGIGSGWFFYYFESGEKNQEWFDPDGQDYAICTKVWDEKGNVTEYDSCDAKYYQDSTYRKLSHL